MYVDMLSCKNMGPIGGIAVKAGFTKNGSPKPIVFVGKNGSGKSILLSNLADAFHELGVEVFKDVALPMGNGGHKYFKVTSQSHVKLGEEKMLGYLSFGCKDKVGKAKKLEYVYSRGVNTKKELEELFQAQTLTLPPSQASRNLGEDKWVTKDKDLIETEFYNSVLAYFPSYRYAIPDWEGEGYAIKRVDNPLKRVFSGELARPVVVDNARFSTPRWIEDVVIDSRSDIIFTPTGMQSGSNVNNLKLLVDAKKNVEKILSSILEQQIELKLGYRSERESRLAICKAGTNEPISPTFDALSTGQSILADLFLTILRYADSIDINKSIRLADIKGIVVVDEIDAHLHADLQYRILPTVMHLFPNVQFIVTAHAPLFVLGMEKEYGEDGFDLYELPEGDRITAERYREFQKAYDWIGQSKTARDDMAQKVKEATDKVKSFMGASSELLVVTEGPTDWMHMERAWNHLKTDYPELDGKLRFFHYHPVGKGDGEQELSMGHSELVKMCEQFAKLQQPSKIVFIADADKPKETRNLIDSGRSYKSWGKNVYSFQIPDSGLRDGFEKVCIEHYYNDEELRTPRMIDSVDRRLFLAGEFNGMTGQTSDHVYFYENHKSLAGRTSYEIIEGDQGNRVIKLMDDPAAAVNLALPKYCFAKAVYKEEGAFASLGFESFRKIFNILKLIVQDDAPPTSSAPSAGGDLQAALGR